MNWLTDRGNELLFKCIKIWHDKDKVKPAVEERIVLLKLTLIEKFEQCSSSKEGEFKNLPPARKNRILAPAEKV